MTKLAKIVTIFAVFAPLAAQAAHAKLVAAMDHAYHLSFPVPQAPQIAAVRTVHATPVRAQHKG
jgi:hypothetical protein